MITSVALFILGISRLSLLVLGTVIPRSGCDVGHAKIEDLPSTLPAPSSTTSFVAVAFGTQNYTCGAAGTFSNVGAVAELLDISCLVDTPIFPEVQDILYDIWKEAPPKATIASVITRLNFIKAPIVLGQHYFIQNPITGQGISPKWDFTSEGDNAGNANAFVVGAKAADISAPTGSQDIDWLALNNVLGSLADQVYRVDTHMGQPPSSCTPGSPDIFVKYTSKYWFFGGSVKH